MNGTKIGFIGGGNMANAIIGGLIAAGFNVNDIVVSEPFEVARANLTKQYGVKTIVDNSKTISNSDSVLILAVKPQVMKQVATGIVDMVKEYRPLIISIAAGITCTDLSKWLTNASINPSPSIIRAMPNTPALVSEGATGMFAYNCKDDQKIIAFSILKSVSKTLYWVENESLIDAVTALSG
jgi:pyrroline-5-carboxylate reductase